MDPSKQQYPAPPYPAGPHYPPAPGGMNPTVGGYPNPGYPNQGFQNPGYPNANYGGFSGGPQPPVMGFHMPIHPEIHVEQPKNDNLPMDDGFGFTEKSIRRGFIRKVYSILMVQLLISVGFITLFLYHDGIRNWSSQNRWFSFVAMGGMFVMVIVLSCCSSVCRKAPANYICLGLLTLFTGVLLGAVSSTYNEQSVLLAVGITTVVCLGLTLFSFQTKIDFTRLNGFLFVCLIVLLCFGLVAMFFPGVKIVRMVYAALGALLFSVYLIHDTQLLMGGDHKYALSPEEYIFASVALYLDIVNIFLFMLSLVGNR